MRHHENDAGPSLYKHTDQLWWSLKQPKIGVLETNTHTHWNLQSDLWPLGAHWRWPRQGDWCMCSCFYPLSPSSPSASCWFFAVRASLFSSRYSSRSSVRVQSRNVLLWTGSETFNEFYPQWDPDRIEFTSEGDVTDRVRLCASTHHESLPLQIRHFRYFLLNAVTYGPVLYLLSAMQLSL